MIRRLSKHLLDALEFPSEDLRHSGKDVHVFDRNYRKPHSRTAHEASTARDIGHSQVCIDAVGRIVLTKSAFQLGMPIGTLSESGGNSVHRQIVVSRPDTTCGKNIIVHSGELAHFRGDKI